MLNVVAIMGRLVADPELKITPAGISVCTFRIACDRNFVQQGQQLYLRPYMGLDKEQIGVTNDKGECLGFVPGEYREYILSRIEAHRMTHTTVEAVEAAAGNQTVSIKIIC